jgi:hypothetical protein
MKKIQLYECDACGESGSKKEIEAHEKKCIQRKKLQQKEIEKHNKQLRERNNLRLQAESPEHFASLISGWIKKKKGTDILIEFENLHYRSLASNTHDCPVGGVTNWHKAKNHPLGYPGLVGRVTITKTNHKGKGIGDIIDSFEREFPGFNTGTGGGGSWELSYCVTLFLSDFPKILKKYKEWEKLSNKYQAKENEKNRRRLLKSEARSDAINSDELLKSLDEERSKINDLIIKRTDEITEKSDNKHSHLDTVPKKFDFNEDRYSELSDMFRIWN